MRQVYPPLPLTLVLSGQRKETRRDETTAATRRYSQESESRASWENFTLNLCALSGKRVMEQNKSAQERPNYGIDAPYVLASLSVSGFLCLLLALIVPSLRGLYSPAISLLATSAVWLYGSKIGKLRLREILMDSLQLKGDEQVLDAGCGSGLLLIAAAKRLNAGGAVGVDIWRKEDLVNNHRETTLRNARLEGVAERIQVENGDVRQLPFGDATFDVVVSLNVLHNISEREGRDKALTEIMRVLKPGGRLLICDFRNVGEYVGVLGRLGAKDAHKTLTGWVGFFPMFAAVANKSSENIIPESKRTA